MPEFNLTVTGAPMISLRKPLGSLESAWTSASGLSPLVDIWMNAASMVGDFPLRALRVFKGDGGLDLTTRGLSPERSRLLWCLYLDLESAR